jgi:hypothetical protein
LDEDRRKKDSLYFQGRRVERGEAIADHMPKPSSKGSEWPKSPLWQKVCAHSYGTEINAPFEIPPFVWRFDLDEIHRGTIRKCTIVFDIQTMFILQKPIERPLSKDVSPPACDPLLSEDPLRRARVVSGESVARRSLSSFHRAESDGHQRPLEWIPIKGTKGTFWYQAKRLDKFQLLVRGIGFLGIHIYSQRPVDDFGQDRLSFRRGTEEISAGIICDARILSKSI